MYKIAITGGGIGGLTTAIALQQRGFDVTVYEAAAEIHEAGAGLWVAPNALAIFARLGLADVVKAAGNTLQSSLIGDHHGRALTRVDLQKIMARYGHGTLAIHRGKLQTLLLRQLKPGTVHTHKRLQVVRQDAQQVHLQWADGSSSTCDLLVGADGIHSVVREQVFGPAPLRYSGQTCWRGVAQMQLPDPKNAAELWGTQGGLRASYSQINADEVYWYVTAKAPAGQKMSRERQLPHLLDLVSEFESDIQNVLKNTLPERILHNDLYDLRPTRHWWQGRVVLLGDAVHATTPNLGQGACQAVEDAWVLADCLQNSATYAEAFATYTSRRLPKAHFVTNTSLQIARLSNVGGALGYRLRNWLLRVAPSSVAERQFDYLFRLDY
jgi:2-polyprenyl-6-methoxyphenol hydroxylase-like FAD-dependent oxidoreductase